jgi:hypothetical protein
MEQTNYFNAHPIRPAIIGKRMLFGGGIALVLITIFLSGVGEPDPSWPKLWYIQPLIIVPIAGAMGAAFSHFLDGVRYQGGWKTAFAVVFSLFVFIVALWMGTVLGLNGTLWN